MPNCWSIASVWENTDTITFYSMKELWRHFMDWYGNFRAKESKYSHVNERLAFAFVPFVIVAFFVFFFVLFALYG